MEYRVTKYDPAYRDSSGAYTREEWTSIRDIGRSFNGVVLSLEDYKRVEDAYVTTVVGFLRESGQLSLTVKGLENHWNYPIEVSEGSVVGLEQLEPLIRLLLREKFWCRLEGHTSFLHFGWDYYMYVGVPRPCPQSQDLASRLGLFVEEFRSPYKPEEEPGLTKE